MKINPATSNPATAMQKPLQFLKLPARKLFLMAGVIFALAGVSTFSSHAATLAGHVPAIVSQLSALGEMPPNTNLNLSIGLPLRNREALTNLLAQIYDPASTNYHHYLTAEQFTEQFGPTEEDYAKVIGFAQANGLSVTKTHPNRMLLDVHGPAAAVEKAFNVTLRVYQHPTENRRFFAPNVEPSVPATLPILDVGGLDNLRRPYPHYKLGPASNPVQSKSAPSGGSASNPAPNATTGSGPFGNYIGDDFRNAYAPGTPLDGSGQVVAFVQFDGYVSNDIVAYANLAGRTNIPPLQNILINGFNGLPTGSGGEVEVSLDLEMVVSMAPGLSKIMVYEGNPFNFHPNDVLNQIATDNAARQISCSWGWSGGPSATTDQIFQQMALQGQTFFTASGDSDAYPAGMIDNPFVTGTPSDNPYVTSVGGLTLTMNGTGASYASETVWNWGIRYGSVYDGVGSSGGFSSYYAIPTWQTNVNMATRGGSTTFRNFPDVAMTGDDVFVIADGGFEYPGTGGTSCAAPLWAGFMALVNQQATNNGLAPIGFLNPAIYKIAASAAYTNCFHDTTTGNNTWSGSPALFYATTNYDLCSGLGSPTGTNLINALAGVGSSFTNPITHITPPPPPYGSTLASLNGGNPNGTWQLFVQDDTAFNSGVISNGWILTLTTANLVGFSSDLELTMTASASTVTVSNIVTYTLAVTNYGPSISSNILVADKLPVGVTVVSATPSQGSLTGLNWNVGTLAVGAGAQMVLAVRPNVTGSLLNYATASADTPDGNPDNDFASVTVNVITPTAPQLSGAYVGGNGAFQFTVTSYPGVTNIIQASTNLTTWIPIYTNVGSFIYTNLDATNYPQRFYRTLMLP
jgi:uncharacterized repeat protein (TIGR01451 family)